MTENIGGKKNILSLFKLLSGNLDILYVSHIYNTDFALNLHKFCETFAVFIAKARYIIQNYA